MAKLVGGNALRPPTDGGNVLATITAISGLVGLIASLIFVAVQTRAVSEQVRIANNLNGTNALDMCLNNVREIYFKMLEFPGTRRHFYEDVPCPTDEVERERVLLIAEALADVLETGLVATRRIPATESLEDWRDYSRFIRDHSPAIRDLITEHPLWWPELRGLN
ncbi:hypothetical protein AB0H94_17445 [Streptomyces purpurascens]|uniref:hypothetical protein n=1 Tax=Streptomyces purpurascens TaxID=1924 RepID=UPI0033E2FB95